MELFIIFDKSEAEVKLVDFTFYKFLDFNVTACEWGLYVLRNEKIYFNGNQFGLRVMMICNSNAKCRKIHRFICCVVVNVLDDSDYLLELERRVTSFLELCS